MNEMQLLEEFRAVVAPPDPGTLAQARARVLDGAAAGQGSRRARGPRLAGGWPKLALTGLAAAATATAVTVALAAPRGAPSHRGSAGLAAKELAYRIADVAAARPRLRPGQWLYVEAKVVDSAFSFSKRGQVDQAWITAGGTRSATLVEPAGKLLIWPCPLGGSPPHGGCRPMMILPNGHVVPLPISHAELGSLPHSPAALDRYLASLPLPGAGPAPFREFELVTALLGEAWYAAPPALTAELYRALGIIPGVTVNRHAVDIAGRHGIGFQITVPQTTYDHVVRQTEQFILNPKTYDMMGTTDWETDQPPGGAAPIRTVWGSATLKTALVSGPGIVP